MDEVFIKIAREKADKLFEDGDADDVCTALIIDELCDEVGKSQPVRGRWKYYHKQNIAVCTNCSFERDLDANFGNAVSCPNCGAKMDKE